MSIVKALMKGAVWNAVSQFGSQGINIVALVVLSRLLEPRDFGLAGMAMVFTSFLGYFSEWGLTPSMIQKKGLDELDCSTVFWSTLIFSLTIYGLVFVSAPLVAYFYKNQSLILITRVLFAAFLFSPLAFVPESLEKKALRYDRIAVSDLVSAIFSGATAIGMAFVGFGVWSLVAQQILLVLIRGVVLISLTKWRPRWIFSVDRLRTLLRSGVHFTFNNVLGYMADNIDSLLIGKFLGPASLGIYNMASRIAKYLTLKLRGIYGHMLFPAFASFSEDHARVRKNFTRVSLAGGVLLAPLFIGLFFGMETLTFHVFGAKWLETIPITRIFIVYLIFESVGLADGSLMYVLDKVRTVNRVRIGLNLSFLVLGYFAVRHFGLMGVAAVFSLIGLADLVIFKTILLKLLKYPGRDYWSNLKLAGVMAAVFASVLGVYYGLAFDFCYTWGYLAGEMLLAAAIYGVFLRQCKLIDFKNKTLELDRWITICR